MVPSEYLTVVVTYRTRNSSSLHERMVYFFSTIFLLLFVEAMLLEKALDFMK
jgi:hypothetical protein